MEQGECGNVAYLVSKLIIKNIKHYYFIEEPTVEEQIVDNVDSNSSDHAEISSDEENSDDFDDDDAENDPSYDFAWSK